MAEKEITTAGGPESAKGVVAQYQYLPLAPDDLAYIVTVPKNGQLKDFPGWEVEDTRDELLRSSAESQLKRTWVEANLPNAQIEEIRSVAIQVFEDSGKATKWLQRPNLATYNKPPISLVGTPEGYDRVKQVLMRIEYGNLA